MKTLVSLIALVPLRHDEALYAKGDEFTAKEGRAAQLIKDGAAELKNKPPAKKEASASPTPAAKT